MSLYGDEWITSDVEAVEELMQWLADRKTEEGCTVILQRIVTSKEEAHWLLDCRGDEPHAHLMMKWKDEAHG